MIAAGHLTERDLKDYAERSGAREREREKVGV
jgi:hypothetical protein